MRTGKSKVLSGAFLLLCALVLSLLSAQPSQAALKKVAAIPSVPQKVLAIIDTGLDPRTTAITKNVVSEACFSHNASCPNGTAFMSGTGSATLPLAAMTNSIFEHGTEVVSASISANSDVKILEVRCSSIVNTSKWEGCTYDDIATSMQWLLDNREDLNLGAIALPMATTPSKECDVDQKNQDLVTSFISAGIPVIASSGNNGIYDGVSNPACIPGVLAISAIDSEGNLASYANYSHRVDFATQGDFTVVAKNNKKIFAQGTSLSAGAFGAQWLQLQATKSFTYDDQLVWIKAHGKDAAARVAGESVKVFTL